MLAAAAAEEPPFRRLIAEYQIAPLRIDTKDNWADLMTKSVDGITYRRLAPILCGHSDELMPIYVNNEVRD
eukprot:SAG11_NODE_123_length_15805_cov_15.133261_13_plen_71_part_00